MEKKQTELKKVQAQVISFANKTITAINESFPVFQIPYEDYKDLKDMRLGNLIYLYVDENNKAHLSPDACNLDRESPPITAEELLTVQTAAESYSINTFAGNGALNISRESFIAGAHWQKRQMAVTGTGEEIREIEISAKEIGLGIALINSKFTLTKHGEQLLTQKEWYSTQSTTIERLTKALEELIKLPIGPIPSRIGREALDSIKK